MSQVLLRSVSGKHCTLTAPFSWTAFLDACEAELGFDKQTVKTRYDGRLQRVVDLAGAADAPASATNANAHVVDVAKFSNVGGNQASHSPPPSQQATTNTLSGAVESRPTSVGGTVGGDGPLPRTTTILVFGRPPVVHRLHAAQSPREGARGTQRARAQSTASAHHMTPPLSREFPGPLPYPHCPDGLRDMASLVNGNPEMVEFFPMAVYRHPTMQYIIRESAGNMAYLHAVLVQMSLAAPALFEWVQRSPLLFVRMLNRHEPSAQEMRTMAMLQLMQQLSSEVARGNHEFTLELGHEFVSGVELHVTFESGLDVVSSDSELDSDSQSSSSPHEGDAWDDDADVHERGGAVDDADGVDGDDHDFDDDSAEIGVWLDARNVQFVNTEASLLAALGLGMMADGEFKLEAPPGSGTHNDNAVCSHDGDVPLLSTVQEPVGAEVAENNHGMPQHASPLPSPSCDDGTASSVSPTSPVPAFTHTTDEPDSARPIPEGQPSEFAWQAAVDAFVQRMSSLSALGVSDDCFATDPTLPADADHLTDSLFSTLQMFLTEHASATATHSPQAFMKAASHFFANLEELYVMLAERSSSSLEPLASDVTHTLAGRACCAALSQQLLCECASLLLLPPAAQAAAHVSSATAAGAADPSTEEARRTPAWRRTSADGHLRVGALRNYPDAESVLLRPTLRWVAPGGPQTLLRELFKTVQGQHAGALLWLTSHYFTKKEGKTVQTVGYVLLNTGQVRLARLPFNSKAHKQDDVAAVMERIARATTASGEVPNTLRAEWGLLMKRQYKNVVKPLEAHLPTPNSSANPLYVVDTRHVLSPREPAKVASDSAVSGSQARWFAAYSDERNMLCADKWCITCSERVWNVIFADEAPWSSLDPSQPSSLLLLGSPSTTAPYWLTESLQSLYHFHQYAMSAPPPTALHAVVLHESDCGLRVPLARRRTSHAADRPIVADLRLVDDCSVTAADRLLPQRATVARNAVLSTDDEFYTRLYEKLALFPSMPLCAAVRAVTLALMAQYQAPWRVAEFSLLDYGGVLNTLAPMLNAKNRPSTGTHPAACDVPANTLEDSAAMVQDGETREYARSHGVLNLFEAMLSHVMEARPATSLAALDSLIDYVETSKAPLSQQVAAAAVGQQSASAASASSLPHRGAVRAQAPTEPTEAPVAPPHTPSAPPGNAPKSHFTRRRT